MEIHSNCSIEVVLGANHVKDHLTYSWDRTTLVLSEECKA